MTNDIASELAKLHELTGAEFSRQVERIAQMKVFHPLEENGNIYSVGLKKSDDYDNLLAAAKKAVTHGYTVYMLPNPEEGRTADFIFEKKGLYRLYELKTIFGKSSVRQDLLDSIGQCNRILLNLTRDYSTRLLGYAIKSYFEINDKAIEVLIFKGGKHISVKRVIAISDDFFPIFKKAYER